MFNTLQMIGMTFGMNPLMTLMTGFKLNINT